MIKQDAIQVRNAVLLLEQEKESLRRGIRKLKIENNRIKQKMKGLQDLVKQLKGTPKEDGSNFPLEATLDYDEIGRDFILVGGIRDPLSLRYEAILKDTNGIQHKSAERFYWYKMAEKFNDKEAMRKILEAPNVIAAEEAVKEIKGFDENVWNKLKLAYWEEGQLLKLRQVPWIAHLLIVSGTTYIAAASGDKYFGTGWRKNRQESNQPLFWDGENLGGKSLMKLRHQLKKTHQWIGPNEEEEAKKKYNELKRTVWRRIDPAKRVVLSLRGVHRGGMRNGSKTFA
jgi:ribA/ribD-fused uncharacterized protein